MSFCGGIGSRGGGEWLRWTGGVWQVEGGWKVYRDGVLMGGKKKRDGKIDFTAEHTDRPLAVSQTRAKKINHPYRYFFFSLTSNTTARTNTRWEPREQEAVISTIAPTKYVYIPSRFASLLWQIRFGGNVIAGWLCLLATFLPIQDACHLSSRHREEVGLEHQN